MAFTDLLRLLALSALWGASYLFMRQGAPEFGAAAFAGLRATLAAGCLVGWVVWRGDGAAWRRHWRPIAVVGLANSALPFLLWAYAAQSLTAGVCAVFSATTPLFVALIGRLWFGQTLGWSRLVGVLIGLAGVAWLVGDSLGRRAGAEPPAFAGSLAACLAAAVLYAFSGHFTRAKLHAAPPALVAAGSQVASALVLAIPAALRWPAVVPSGHAWLALGALVVGCTAVAYALYFRLIANVGPARTATVTYLIPVFGAGWGWWVLGEAITARASAGAALILAGTALTTGVVRSPRARLWRWFERPAVSVLREARP